AWHAGTGTQAHHRCARCRGPAGTGCIRIHRIARCRPALAAVSLGRRPSTRGTCAMKRPALLLCLLLSALLPLQAATISRVEPANWWVGMQHHQVELLLYGRDIATLQARVTHPGVR